MYSMSKEINYYYYFNLRSNAGINCINCNATDSFVPNVRKCVSKKNIQPLKRNC